MTNIVNLNGRQYADDDEQLRHELDLNFAEWAEQTNTDRPDEAPFAEMVQQPMLIRVRLEAPEPPKPSAGTVAAQIIIGGLLGFVVVSLVLA